MVKTGRHGAARYVAYGDRVHVGGTVAWRNNNPGNLRDTEFSRAQGAVGRDSSGFAIFPDEATGRAAQEALLGTATYRSLSLGDALARYAPSNENDTEAYTQFVEERLADRGIDRTTPMSEFTADDRAAMAGAMRDFEGNRAGTVYGPDDAPDWAKPLFDADDAPPVHDLADLGAYTPPVATSAAGGNITFNESPMGDGADGNIGVSEAPPQDPEPDAPPAEPGGGELEPPGGEEGEGADDGTGGAPMDPLEPPEDEPAPLIPLCEHGFRHRHDRGCCCGGAHFMIR